MATIKNFNTSYTLNGPQVTVTGNLIVLGNTTQVQSANTSILDNYITINDGETGNGVSVLGTTAGILVDRGTAANVYLRWNETTKTWQISDQTGGNFANIIAGGLIADTNPTLSANLNTWNSAITSNVGSVIFGSNIQINNSGTAPSTVITNATVVYAGSPGAGTSGIYVLNGSAANQELVTKARAVGYSILL
jgi:hypothetical protein